MRSASTMARPYTQRHNAGLSSHSGQELRGVPDDAAKWILIFVVVSFPLSEIIRVSIPGQPIVITALPLLCFTYVWVIHLRTAVPTCLMWSFIPLLIMCLIGIQGAIVHAIPARSVLIAMVAELGWCIPACVAYYCGKSSSLRFSVAFAASVVVTIALCLSAYHLCTGEELWSIPTIAGAGHERPYGNKAVAYCYGVFRSAPTYAAYLVFMGVQILVTWFSPGREGWTRTSRAVILTATISIAPQLMMAARRSQFAMFGLVLCGVFAAAPRRRRGLAAVIICCVFILGIITFGSALRENTRIQHVTSFLWKDWTKRNAVNAPNTRLYQRA